MKGYDGEMNSNIKFDIALGNIFLKKFIYFKNAPRCYSKIPL